MKSSTQLKSRGVSMAKKDNLADRLADFERLRKRLEEKQKQLDRIEGQLQEIQRMLKEEFDCKNADEALEKAEELQADLEATEGRLKKLLDEAQELREGMEDG